MEGCTIRRSLVAALAVLAGLSICLADSNQDEAAKQVQQALGKDIAQVKTANDKPRAAKLAQTILDSAADAAQGPALQAELARTALDLALWAGTPEAFAVADNAALALANYQKLPLLERQNLVIRVRTAQLAAAVKADQRAQANAALAEAFADLAQACEDADDIDAASANYVRAAAAARAANLTDLADQYTQENLRLQRQRLFNKELSDVQDELRAATAGNNPPLIQQDNEKIGLLYLTRMADIAQAAPFLAKSGGDWAGVAPLLAKLSAGEKLDIDQTIQAADALKRAADRSEAGPKSALMEQVLQLCDSPAQADGPQAAKLDQLRQAAKAYLDKNPPDKMAALRKALGDPAGLVKVNPDGSVTISYTFVAPKQLKDWTMTQGQWNVDGSGLTWQSDRGDIFNNIRFRADKPLTLIVEGTTNLPGSIGAMLAGDKTDRFAAAHLLLNPRQRDGWQTGGLGGKPSMNVKPLPGGPYKLKIAFDGSGVFTFTLNGQLLGKMDLPKGESLANGLRMGLVGTQKNLGSFRSASIQGQPVAAAAQPATQPAPVKTPPAPAVQPAPAPKPTPPPQPAPKPSGQRRGRVRGG